MTEAPLAPCTIGAVSIEHYENFPVASWLCPPALRPPITAIYHFARTADDIADEGDASAEQRLADLKLYQQCLHAADRGELPTMRWPGVFAALQAQIRQWQLPLPLLDALLSAFMQDTANPVHDDQASLLDYCSRSANPVGRLLLHLYGITDAVALRRSDAICSALQLINFWQDIQVDLSRGRCYLTRQDLAAHGLPGPEALMQARQLQGSAASRALVKALVEQARALMLEGAPLVHQLHGRVAWELRLVVQGGLRILEKIEHMNFSTFERRPTVGAADVPLMLWRAARMPAR